MFSDNLGQGCEALLRTVNKLAKKVKDIKNISTSELEEFLDAPCHGRPKEFQLASMLKTCGKDDSTRIVMDKACQKGLWSRFAVVSFICAGCLGMSLLLLLVSAYHLIRTIWCLGAEVGSRHNALLHHSGWIPVLLALACFCNAVMCIIYVGFHASQGDSLMKQSRLGVLIAPPKGIGGIEYSFRLMSPGWGYGVIVLIAVLQTCAAVYSSHLMRGVKATASAMQPRMCSAEGLELAQLPLRGVPVPSS